MLVQTHSYEELRSAGFFPIDNRRWADSRPLSLSYLIESEKGVRVGSFLTQLYQLLGRDLRSLKRNPGAMVVDALVTHLVIGFLTGAFFFNVGASIKSNNTGVSDIY
jgi:hypothetical protein